MASFTYSARARLLSNLPLPRAISAAGPFRSFSQACPRLAPSVKVVGDHGLKDLRPSFELKDKNFLITGGGQGIGYAAVRAIAEYGGNVAVLDQLDCPVTDFEVLPNEFDVKLKYVKADVTDEKSLSGAFEEVISEFGSIDGCITAAGIVTDRPFLEHTWEEASRIQTVNVLGTFFSAQLAAKQMQKQETGGSIVMIASVCGHCAVPGHRLSAYHASKGAVMMLSKALAVELAPANIRVNTISPGYIETPMTEMLREQHPHLVEIMHSAPPMKRIGNRNDLTGAMVYLLSDASAYTTGTDIAITGGLHAGRIEA